MFLNMLKRLTSSKSSFHSKLPPIYRVGIVLQWASYSQLRVKWRKDVELDSAILVDKRWQMCAKVVKEVLNEPNQVIMLLHLERRRERLRMPVKAATFIKENPLLFEVYLDRLRPKTDLVKFVRPSAFLREYLEEEKRAYAENELLIVEKLCKLLMMAKNNVISADKLPHFKRDFGFPNDLLTSIVPKYPNYFRLVKADEENSFLELVSREPKFAKSVILRRAEKEEELTGSRVQPTFNWKLPNGFLIKKEMREWVRDWLEMPYINPYDDPSDLHPSSREMEKRMVGVIHEVLSLTLLKRMPIPILGKFSEDFRLSNAFATAFTRHSGLFYVSLIGGIKTAVLREAYKRGVLIDREPLLEIREKFVGLLEKGWKMRMDEMNLKAEAGKKNMELDSKNEGERRERASGSESGSGMGRGMVRGRGRGRGRGGGQRKDKEKPKPKQHRGHGASHRLWKS